MSPAAPSPRRGVSTASSAPAPIASNTRHAFAPMQLVTIRIAHGRPERMIRRVASIPSHFGMIRSISTTSGGCAAHSSTACAPSVATHSTRCSGRRASARRIASTASGRSLTMPMFTSGILRSVRRVGGGPGSWKAVSGRRRRTGSAGGRHGILFDWRRPACCHAARAAAIEKIAYCAVLTLSSRDGRPFLPAARRKDDERGAGGGTGSTWGAGVLLPQVCGRCRRGARTLLPSDPDCQPRRGRDFPGGARSRQQRSGAVANRPTIFSRAETSSARNPARRPPGGDPGRAPKTRLRRQWLRAYPWISARIIPSTVASSRSASCSDSSTSAA
ncbi:hypothetical protein BamIOP4010DRAFT_0916 [Burkholderia ambifaria IOP40-10]|uniref:Uncharacterized protein n=1 Tax=Burkholderia ambifaria IOP40-10 TaxID=396596 RepID=B1FA57_9BURK|nr:hypothetical protein BamIOP4010DRAFT_0916 [Burkholderia ambifaria IOP40-10]